MTQRILCLSIPAVVALVGCASSADEHAGLDVSASTTVSPNEKTAFDFFLGKGLSPVQSAGIVGNLQQESNLDPTIYQIGGGPGRGIAQWSAGDRWDSGGADSATAFAQSRGADVWSLDLQLEFIWYELTTYPNYGLAQLRAATNVTDAVTAFQDLFEICGACNQSNRIAQANAVLAACGNDKPGSAPSSGGSGPSGPSAPSAASCSGLDDGAYCGGHDIGGDPNTLYTCSGGALSNTTACTGGCTRNPGSIDDACAASGAPAGPECAGASGSTVGVIHDKYVSLGECGSFLGGPTTEETGAPDGVGRYNVFQNGSIYWTPQTGAFEVHGAIRDQWKVLGWEAGVLGYPITDETKTPDGVGRYNVFQKGSIYYSPNTGAHEVYGVIRDKWASTGWEAGPLGYPTSGEYAVANGRQNDFEHGSITFDASSGQATVTQK
jgi:hypothetical protein